jgi:hypothetical protein
VPERYARVATHWPAVAAALVAPFVIGVVFLRAPVLPNSAIEVTDARGGVEVVRGQLITVDDTSTTMLEPDGQVKIVPNGQVRSRTLCANPAPAPDTRVVVRGWPADESALEWVAPTMQEPVADSRCLGRAVNTGP